MRVSAGDAPADVPPPLPLLLPRLLSLWPGNNRSMWRLETCTRLPKMLATPALPLLGRLPSQS
eukprot:1145552-Pelagomonas_calceolata.AAC.1